MTKWNAGKTVHCTHEINRKSHWLWRALGVDGLTSPIFQRNAQDTASYHPTQHEANEETNPAGGLPNRSWRAAVRRHSAAQNRLHHGSYAVRLYKIGRA